MKTDSIQCKVTVIWVILGAAGCLGAEFGQAEDLQMKLLNQSQPKSEDINLSPTRFKISHPEKVHTLSDYLHSISQKIVVNDSSQAKLTDDKSHGKVVVVTRVGKDSKTNEGEWIIVAAPRNDDFNDITENESQEKEVEYSLDYLLETEDIPKYVDDYENILFSFKNLINIAKNPSLKQKIDEKKSSDHELGKKFNVTYVMPIPNKNDKYFKILISNLTEYQYNEINTLLQEHNRNKANKTQEGIETERVSYYDTKDEKKHVTSRSLTDSSMLYADFEEPTSQMSLPSNLTDAIAFFQKELTEKGYSPLLQSLSSDLPKHFLNKTENKEPEVTFVIRNNGLSIPVATDYKQNSLQDNTATNAKQSENKSDVDSQYMNTQPQVPTLSNPLYTQRSITSQRNQRPEHSSKNKLRMLTSSVLPQTNAETNLSQEQATKNGTSDMSSKIPTSNGLSKLEDKSTETKPTSLGINMNSQIPGELSEIAKDLGNVNILQAANFIIDMKKKLEEEERKKNERYKSYIKSYLRGENSNFPIRSENGSIMKINKQDDILEELKLLMLDYFTFMNFNLFDPVGTNSSLAIESILNSTDLFELMERSSKLVKLNVQFKLQNESKEPTGFVKKIVESQVEKCRELTAKLTQRVNRSKEQSNEPITKRTHKTYMVFTRCMNLKLTKCLKGFSIWLQRGKFFRRPQFNLNRAYENYETEKNLYCLRTHNALTSESNTRGIKVKPRLKVNRKTGIRRIIKGGAKSSRPMRKMRKEYNIEGRVGIKKLKRRTQMSIKTSNDTQNLIRKSEELNPE